MMLRRDIAVLAIAVGIQLAAAQVIAAEGGNKGFYRLNPTDSNIQRMEDQRRAEWQMPHKIVDYLSVKQGDNVADIGSGTGYFTMIFAAKVGENGTVYAADTDKDIVAYLDNRSKKEGINNIRSILAKSDDPMLPSASLDLIFICNTYTFIANRIQYLERLKEHLKSTGRLAIVSYNKVESPVGPPLAKRVSRETTIQEAEKAGFKLSSEHFFLPYQHFMVFEKR
jgi:arsenite methyltransferase